MTQTRRNFLKTAGAAGAAALAGSSGSTAAKTLDRTAKANTRSGPQTLPKNLTFCTLRKGNEYSLGLKTSKGILDVKKAAQVLHKNVPLTIDEVIQGGDGLGLAALVEQALAGNLKSAFIEEAKAEFGPCVTNPEKVIMLGYNYKKHVIEVKQQMPTSPVLFNKYNNALNCHNGTIELPEVAKKFDYEVELVVVMGKTAHNVSEADALSYVLGYCVGNDFSARDLQFKTSQLMLGKTSDGFGPIGPYLVTADQIPDPQNLNLDCRVNGEVRQSSNTNDMIFSCANIISYVSHIWTLKPGDIFFTGTPSGVINGMPPEKQVWLKAGDKIACSIEKLGELRFGLANPKQAKAT